LSPKVKEIIEWPTTNVTDIRSFLRLAGYYRTFAKKNFEDKIFPNQFLKESHYIWVDIEVWKEISRVKAWLTTTQILALLVEGEKYTIYNDGSKNGFGVFWWKETKW